MVIWLLALVRWKLRYMLLAQRSDVVLRQVHFHLVVVNSREVKIKVHVVGTEVRYSPRSD